MGLQFFILLLTARYLGPEGRGILVASTGWIYVLATIFHFSLPQVALNQAVGKNVRHWLAISIGTLGSLYLVVTLVLSLAISSFVLITGQSPVSNIPPHIFLLALAGLLPQIWFETGNSQMMALGKVTRMNLAQISGNSLNLILILILLVWSGKGIEHALLAFVLGQWIIAGLLFIFSTRSTETYSLDFQYLKTLIKGALVYHINTIGTLVTSYASILFINSYLSAQQTGLYQLPLQIINILLVIPNSINSVSYSFLIQSGPDEGWMKHQSLILKGALLVLILMVLLFFFCGEAVLIVGGEQFRGAESILRILLAAVPGMFLSLAMTSQWVTRGMFVLSSLVTISMGALNLTLLFWMVPLFGIQGAANAFVFTSFFSLVTNLIFIMWIIKRPQSLANKKTTIVHS